MILVGGISLNYRLKALLFAVLAALVVFYNFYNITEKDLAIQVDEEKSIALEKVSLYSERIESMIITGDNYAGFYEFFVSQDYVDPIEEFQNFAYRIVKIEEVVEDIIMTEGSVIKSIYPYEGNQGAVGYDLMEDETRRPFIERAINERTTITQGPIESFQGRTKIYIRKPLYKDNDGSEDFIGLISVGIDFKDMIDKVGLKYLKGDFYFALKSEKADGEKDFIWGMKNILDKEPVIKEIKIPGQEWQLAAYPHNGWVNEQGVLKAMPIINHLITIIVLYVTYQLVLQYLIKSEEAETDDLTGIMNKRAFLCSIDKYYKDDNQTKHALIVMDVNDFKLINDTYGHIVGDLVLIEVANRVQSLLKNVDSFCRLGGDEFSILIHDIEDEIELKTFISCLKNEFIQAMNIHGHEIQVSISVGSAVYPTEGVSHLELYQIADTRMYENKRKSKELNMVSEPNTK